MGLPRKDILIKTHALATCIVFALPHTGRHASWSLVTPTYYNHLDSQRSTTTLFLISSSPLTNVQHCLHSAYTSPTDHLNRTAAKESESGRPRPGSSQDSERWEP